MDVNEQSSPVAGPSLPSQGVETTKSRRWLAWRSSGAAETPHGRRKRTVSLPNTRDPTQYPDARPHLGPVSAPFRAKRRTGCKARSYYDKHITSFYGEFLKYLMKDNVWVLVGDNIHPILSLHYEAAVRDTCCRFHKIPMVIVANLPWIFGVLYSVKEGPPVFSCYQKFSEFPPLSPVSPVSFSVLVSSLRCYHFVIAHCDFCRMGKLNMRYPGLERLSPNSSMQSDVSGYQSPTDSTDFTDSGAEILHDEDDSAMEDLPELLDVEGYQSSMDSGAGRGSEDAFHSSSPVPVPASGMESAEDSDGSLAPLSPFLSERGRSSSPININNSQ